MVPALIRLLLTICLAFSLGGAPLVGALAATHTESTAGFDEVRPETAAVSSQRIATRRHDAAGLVRTKATPEAFKNIAIGFAVLVLPRTLTHGRPPSQAPPIV